MIVLLTGATGFIGRALAARLAEQGHSLRALTRNPQVNHPGLPPGCAVFAWRAGSPVPPGALDGADAVIHLAGENIASGRWTAARKARIRDSRVNGTRALVEALRRTERRPAVFLAASAVGVYGDGGDRILGEGEPAGAGFLAGLCRDWEDEILRAGELGMRAAALRLGLVLGKGGVLAKLAPVFRLGGGAVLGGGRQWWSWIHLDDAAGLFIHALSAAGMRGPINAVAGAVPQRDFARALGRVLHRPVVLRAPACALRLGLGEMASSLLEGQRAVPGKAQESGYRFRYPDLEGALRAALATGSGAGA